MFECSRKKMGDGVKLSPNSEFTPNELYYLICHFIPLSLIFHITMAVSWSSSDVSSNGLELCEGQGG